AFDPDLSRRETAVDEAGRVDRRERFEDLDRDLDGALRLERALRSDELRDVDAACDLARDEDSPEELVRAVEKDRDEARVADRDRGFDVFLELEDVVGVLRELGAEDLQRDVLLARHVLRAVDVSEVTLAELLEDPEVSGEDGSGKLVARLLGRFPR